MASPLLQARLDRMRVAALQSLGRSAIPQWIIDNTRHPNDPTKPWSFLHHEYQIGILETDAEYISVIKAAQTGMSELSVRLMLALASLYRSSRFMYVLPSSGFSRKFVVDRVDPVIESSPQLSRELSKEVNNSEIKRIANSFIYFAGAQKTGQAISVPAKGLVMDEVDFCSQSVLTSFYSRLQHNMPGESIVTRFSTPTVPGYGISQLHEAGSQGVYMVWHEKCGQWVVVDPLQDIILPGWQEDTLENFTKADLDDPTLRLEAAFVQCPHCHKPISQSNLSDPKKRAWVHHYPDKVEKSFYVSPLDVAAINTPEKILRNVRNYNRHIDWINFGLGKAFQDAENSVVKQAVEKSATAITVYPGKSGVQGGLIGSDVGKTSHLLVGVRDGKYMDIIWAERIRQDGSGNLVSTWKERMDEYGAWKMVVDAGPDISSPQQLIEESVYGRAWACYFTRGSSRRLSDLDIKEEEQIIGAYRTSIIDKVVKQLNGGLIRLPKGHPELPTIIKHFTQMKRVSRLSDTTGETTAHWASLSKENHYFFALVYLMIADDLATGQGAVVALPDTGAIRKVQVGGAIQDRQNDFWSRPLG
ncbi:MAG TPA: hypothetical protein ENJ30_12650 [Desulfobulbaceae bacterium]|nr:hypothetical protein [Desulfobulbaceae bacterium]